MPPRSTVSRFSIALWPGVICCESSSSNCKCFHSDEKRHWR